MTTTHTSPATAPLVAISGYARAGKDAAAGALLDDGYTRRKFATHLYRAVYELNPVIAGTRDRRVQSIVDEIGWEAAKDTYPDVRVLLQRMGTDVGRRLFGADFWVQQAIRELTAGEPAVFTDCRFPNEARAVVERGGVVLRIERPGVGPATDKHGVVHESEVALDSWPFDAVILNSGTPNYLHLCVRATLQRLAATATVSRQG